MLWLRLSVRFVLVALALWLVVKLGPGLLSLFLPFLLALAVAAVLNPLVKRLQQALGWSRGVLTLLVLLLLFGLAGGALGLLGYGIAGQLMSLVQNWSELWAGLQSAFDQVEVLFLRLLALAPPQITNLLVSTVNGFLDWLNVAVPDYLAGLGVTAGEKAMGLPSFVVALIIFLMATYLLTADYPYLRARLVQGMDDSLLRFLSDVRAIALGAFGGYLKAEFLLSVGVFFILLVGFTVTRQSYGLLLALGLAVLDFIPILGAGTVMVPWAFIALFTGDFRIAVELMVIWGIIAVFRRVMEPKFVGDQTGLSPIASLVSIYVGMKAAGVLGMILGPILMLVLVNLSKMGTFRGVRADLAAAARDISALLAQRPDTDS